jgi:hypothetical protein
VKSGSQEEATSEGLLHHFINFIPSQKPMDTDWSGSFLALCALNVQLVG